MEEFLQQVRVEIENALFEATLETNPEISETARVALVQRLFAALDGAEAEAIYHEAVLS